MNRLFLIVPSPPPVSQSLINEKKAVLERLQLQHESLKKVDAEQKATIERLSNNEA